MEFLAQFGDGPEVLLMIGIPLGVILLLVAAFTGDDSQRQRARRVDKMKLNHAANITPDHMISAKRSTNSSDIRALDDLIKKLLPQQKVLRQRLARAGLDMSLGVYVLICLLVAVVGFVAANMTGFMPSAAAVLFAIFCGLALPHMTIAYLFKRRQTQFIAYFPEAIDLMVRGVRAGLPITESIKAASEEVPNPVGIELARITDGVRLGRKIDELMWETSERLNLQEFKFFTIALSIQSETGGNLAETLDNLSEVLRSRRQLKRKVKAMSSEAKASAYIIGSLPFIMTALIYFVNAPYIVRLFMDIRGQIMIGFGLFMISIGVLVMYRMVKFEI